eukprot:TRINITY_DN4244_c0_g1_i1.p1 TRINITY_DN4244_c0_g1~~TRINITY_DN4244_c0_g1_i1.p1  ORF type:complete len:282 (-),score=75.14 TRINITY_DN4244_c0_g1_i1:151-996(-)
MSEQQKHVLEAVAVNPNDGQITGEVPAAIVTTYITRIEPFVIWMERRGLRASNFIMEFLGVFFLVFTVGCNVAVGSGLAPISIGVILCSVIYSGGYVSGAHFNPAVSLAVYLRGRKMSLYNTLFYMGAQLLAGVIAAWICYGMFGVAWALPGPTLPPFWGPWRALVAEFFFTAALSHAVLHTGTRQDNNNFYGLAIGFVVLAGASAIGPISGGGMNPAVVTGFALVEALAGNSTEPNAKWFWLYWIAEMLGGAFAAGLYRAIHFREDLARTYSNLGSNANV